MNSRVLKTTNQSIESQLYKVKPEQALAEYIWNGFDANATKIEVNTEINDLNSLVSITVKDNGSGIDYNDLENTLDVFLDSKKKNIFKPITRGKKGRGRFSFIKFCEQANWETFSGKNSFNFEITSNCLNKYEPKNILNTNINKSGTKITFSHIKNIDFNIFNDVIIPFLRSEFTWLLISNPSLKLIINDVEMNLSKHKFTEHQEEFEKNSFKIKNIIWDKKQNQEKSFVYFMNSSNEIVYKESLNLRSFHCSSYVTSDWFDEFNKDSDLLSDNKDKNPQSKIFIHILNIVKNKLQQEYINFRDTTADYLIQQYLNEGVFPEENGDNQVLNKFHREQLISTIKVIYEAEPAVFSKQLNKSQKKILIKLIDRMIQSNRVSDLFDVLHGVVSLSEEDMSRISGLLQRTSLENITKTAEYIRDRLDIIQSFKSLIYDHKKYAKEVPHIQKCVESNLWLFGEKYHLLTSEEEKFEQALRELLKFKEEEHYNKKSLTHPDKNKEMDLFIAQKGSKVGDDDKSYFQYVVIELKRPSIKLGDKELDQIKTYKNVIASEPSFQDENSVWDFILIGNEISNSSRAAPNLRAELDSNKMHGEPGLIQKTGNYRIIVKTWKQILNEFELRYNEISSKLNLKELEIISKTPDELTKDISENIL